MPGIVTLLARQEFEAAGKRQADLAKRRQAVKTGVGRYVDRKQATLSRKLRKALRAHSKVVAAKAKKLYAARLAKDVSYKQSLIAHLVENLESDDLGLTLERQLAPAMLAAFRRAAAVGASQVGLEMGEDITKQVDVAAVAYGEKRGGELIKDFAGTTDDAMRSLIGRAVDDGMSPDELSDAVLDLGAFGEARAEMIARTELAFAHVQGNKAGWAQSGQVVGKRAVLGDLHDVEDICDEAADAGVVGLDEEFVPGAGDPPFHPNCICDIVPVLSEDDDQPGDSA